ncbi:MAG: SsrA-binding protein [Gammaproteobacteria bacterium]|nr:SsrA-binding protein [Gammaproteobacteria bacterium]|tara:strand:- start:97 stop:561 length:465 start_codon:yes stop_codon:yes gene_type:complete
MSKEKHALIVKNKNASRNYKLDESFQAGIVLEGWEVKSLRESKVDIKNSYVNIRKGEAWLIGVKIDTPASLKQENLDTTKSRKLLLNKKEIAKIERLKGEKGLTCVLTRMYWKENLIKCDIAMGKGKKLRDQREDIKKRDWERDQKRLLKLRSK